MLALVSGLSVVHEEMIRLMVESEALCVENRKLLATSHNLCHSIWCQESRNLREQDSTATPWDVPPIWLDEHGERRPTRPCPKFGLPDPVLRLRYEHLRANGWKPFEPFFMMNWCGHGHEYLPWLQSDGYWWLVPILELQRLRAREPTSDPAYNVEHSPEGEDQHDRDLCGPRVGPPFV